MELEGRKAEREGGQEGEKEEGQKEGKKEGRPHSYIRQPIQDQQSCLYAPEPNVNVWIVQLMCIPVGIRNTLFKTTV